MISHEHRTPALLPPPTLPQDLFQMLIPFHLELDPDER
jgi:hypothetical protein